mmetsp:Transcript_68795/g.188810  ORF Transcript_68795/g.188810 Transcript_68795/m.188810 type:complete len:242 (-) Transcript_68795:20-745(-)
MAGPSQRRFRGRRRCLARSRKEGRWVMRHLWVALIEHCRAEVGVHGILVRQVGDRRKEGIRLRVERLGEQTRILEDSGEHDEATRWRQQVACCLDVLPPHVLRDEGWVNHDTAECAGELCGQLSRPVEVVCHKAGLADTESLVEVENARACALRWIECEEERRRRYKRAIEFARMRCLQAVLTHDVDERRNGGRAVPVLIEVCGFAGVVLGVCVEPRGGGLHLLAGDGREQVGRRSEPLQI